MKRFVGLCLAVALLFALAVPVLAQQDQERLRYSGTITLVSKDGKYFTIQRNQDKIPVYYTDKTIWTLRNEPGAKVDDLKEGKRVIVLADPASKDKVMATRVDFRTEQ